MPKVKVKISTPLNPVKVDKFYKTKVTKFQQYCELMDIENPKKYLYKTDFCKDSVFKKVLGFTSADEDSLDYVFAQVCYHMQNNVFISHILKFNTNAKYIIGLFKGITLSDLKYRFDAVVNDIFSTIILDGRISWVRTKSKEEKDKFVLTYINNILRWVGFFLNHTSDIKNRTDLYNYFLLIESQSNIIGVIKHIRDISGIKNGLAYSCDLLKELFKNTHFDVCKPDGHIKSAMEVLYEVTKIDEEVAILTFPELVDTINKIPGCGTTIYELDRILYLLLSGNFFLDENKDSFHNHYLYNLLKPII